jgi:hypothetical protein
MSRSAVVSVCLIMYSNIVHRFVAYVPTQIVLVVIIAVVKIDSDRISRPDPIDKTDPMGLYVGSWLCCVASHL